MLKGTSLSGTSTTRDRVENDYYATLKESVESLLNNEKVGGLVLEPCVGGGHVADVLKTIAKKVDCIDIVDRGYEGTAVACDNTNRNWICMEKEEKYCNIGLTRINDNLERLSLPLLNSIN